MTERRVQVDLRRVFSEHRAEAEAALIRAETAEAKVRSLEQTLLDKEREVKALQDRLDRTEDALAIAEYDVTEAKALVEGLQRRIAKLEAERNV
ncbi:hypothetical protein DFH06DRAFT_1188179 [Mycena polygramma]|nr:hypothetical protein DFH06DRAFT_1188179 [Mycena polygramma]